MNKLTADELSSIAGGMCNYWRSTPGKPFTIKPEKYSTTVGVWKNCGLSQVTVELSCDNEHNVVIQEDGIEFCKSKEKTASIISSDFAEGRYCYSP